MSEKKRDVRDESADPELPRSFLLAVQQMISWSKTLSNSPDLPDVGVGIPVAVDEGEANQSRKLWPSSSLFFSPSLEKNSPLELDSLVGLVVDPAEHVSKSELEALEVPELDVSL